VFSFFYTLSRLVLRRLLHHAAIRSKQRFVGGDAKLTIADAKFDYKFEYLGNGPRLVITPLTDRIYVTATQALNLKMGCAPAGPAGTGKTETTKDLANAMAITCYVFNCSPEMDYMSLGNIFKGLAASGTWGCFDEFNRLVPEVLSVCSVQFKAVCDGIRGQKHRVTIEGDEVNLDWSAGCVSPLDWSTVVSYPTLSLSICAVRCAGRTLR
jgi:dynein heavy chain, axonemal